MADPRTIDQRYEAALQVLIRAALRQIQSTYEDAVFDLAVITANATARSKTFSLSANPFLAQQVETKLRNMHSNLLRIINASIKASWKLANEKNDVFVDKRLKGRTPLPNRVRLHFYDPNAGALNTFLDRKKKGLNLSDRVWKTLDPFRHEMEQAMGLEIAQGTSAAKMAVKFKQYLNEPDKLFRRVRGTDGKLRLSQRARNYKPGQGVYRSSHQNAVRLTATENNLAYRTADFERWQKLDFVIGMEVKLSNNHPEFDICDACKGKYPKDFKFTGWHPRCRCYAVPLMMNDDDYDKLEAHLLGKGAKPDVKHIEHPPAGFSKWVVDNEGRLQGWKSKPYWLTDNRPFMKRLLT